MKFGSVCVWGGGGGVSGTHNKSQEDAMMTSP